MSDVLASVPNAWGTSDPRMPLHRLAVAGKVAAFGIQRVACGVEVNVRSVHHVDSKAGPDAVPCVGAVCPECMEVR
jgi:hypothetical protein